MERSEVDFVVVRATWKCLWRKSLLAPGLWLDLWYAASGYHRQTGAARWADGTRRPGGESRVWQCLEREFEWAQRRAKVSDASGLPDAYGSSDGPCSTNRRTKPASSNHSILQLCTGFCAVCSKPLLLKEPVVIWKFILSPCRSSKASSLVVSLALFTATLYASFAVVPLLLVLVKNRTRGLPWWSLHFAMTVTNTEMGSLREKRVKSVLPAAMAAMVCLVLLGRSCNRADLKVFERRLSNNWMSEIIPGICLELYFALRIDPF